MQQLIIAVTLLAFVAPKASPAQEQPAASDSRILTAQEVTLSDVETLRRIRWIQARLDRGTAGANWWWYGWTVFNGVAVVPQAVIAGVTNDNALRKEMIVGAGTAFVGFAAMFFIPFSSRYAAAQLRTLTDLSTPEARKQSLSHAEQLLAKAAEEQASGQSWFAHLGNFLIAAISSGVLLGFRRYEAAAMNFGASLVSGELFIFTQPTSAIDDWRAYQANSGVP